MPKKENITFNYSLKYLLLVGFLLAFTMHTYNQVKLFKNIEKATSLSKWQLSFYLSYIARDKSSISLNNLSHLPESLAIILSGFKGDDIYLNGLTQIDKSAAIALTGFRGRLHFKSLNENSGINKILKKWNNNILNRHYAVA